MNLPERHDQHAANLALADRMRAVREELFGEQGVPILAEALQLSSRTVRNYESGSAIPPRVLLHFLEITGADPHWLRTGAGPRYRLGESPSNPGSPGDGPGPDRA
jgi:hypothetical protein